MINAMFHKEGSQERCLVQVKGSVYELAMEFAVISKKIAEEFPEVLEITQIMIGDITLREDE